MMIVTTHAKALCLLASVCLSLQTYAPMVQADESTLAHLRNDQENIDTGMDHVVRRLDWVRKNDLCGGGPGYGVPNSGGSSSSNSGGSSSHNSGGSSSYNSGGSSSSNSLDMSNYSNGHVSVNYPQKASFKGPPNGFSGKGKKGKGDKGKKGFSGKGEQGKGGKGKKRRLIRNLSVTYETCDNSKFPPCRSDQKLCMERQPRPDGSTWPDGQRKFYIDYNKVFCVPTSGNCSLCTPGRFCKSEQRCVKNSYPCSKWW